MIQKKFIIHTLDFKYYIGHGITIVDNIDDAKKYTHFIDAENDTKTVLEERSVSNLMISPIYSNDGN